MNDVYSYVNHNEAKNNAEELCKPININGVSRLCKPTRKGMLA